jgi:hypothetical protein
MPLDDQQRDSIQAWMASKSPSPICPSCGQPGPYVAGDVIAPFIIGGPGGEVVMGVTVPMVPIICTHCAFVRLYSAVVMGIVKRTEPPT